MKEAVKRMLVQTGARFAPLLASLTASGLLTAGAVVLGADEGSIVLLALCERMVADARTSGTMKGLATYYRRA